MEIANKAIEVDRRDFNAYKALVANPKVSQADRDSALAKMKELDPFHNTLGKYSLNLLGFEPVGLALCG